MLRILMAFLLGGLIGYERETTQRPAGLRTHMLVAAGSAAFTIVSIYAFVGQGTVRDPARVAAQIVAGVGFLGAGTIWRLLEVQPEGKKRMPASAFLAGHRLRVGDHLGS